MTNPSAAVFYLADVHEGIERGFDFVVDEAEMDAFAVLSGDHNPLHSDRAFAQAHGFEGRVVFGALLVAKISRLIGMELPGRDALWNSLEVQFKAPLIVGKPARLTATVTHVSQAARSVALQLSVTSEGTVLARGKALVSLL